MSKVLLLVGTRKGCFVLESTGDRRDWDVRGPFCEGWPVYHAIFDHDAGGIYAAAASEWHGATVWRSGDLGKTWTQSSEGLGYGNGDGDGLKMSKVSSLSAAHGRLLAGAEQAGIFESRDGGANWKLLSTLDHPASKDWNDPAKQPPGHLGVSAITPHPGDGPEHFWAIVQGFSLFETTDDGATWTARNEGLRADWPREYDDIGFCVHKFVIAPTCLSRMYQQNHCGMHRSDDGGQTWTETPREAERLRLRRRRAPPRQGHVLRHSRRSGHARTMHDGKSVGLAHARCRLVGSGSTRDCRRRTPIWACYARTWQQPPRLARSRLRRQYRSGVREHRRRRDVERAGGVPACDLVRGGG